MDHAKEVCDAYTNRKVVIFKATTPVLANILSCIENIFHLKITSGYKWTQKPYLVDNEIISPVSFTSV